MVMVKKKKKEDKKEISSKYLSFKNNIKNICEDNVINILQDMSIRTTTIIRNTNYFIRYYYVYLFENNMEFPIIDHKMIRDIFSLVSTMKRTYKEPACNILLKEFYDDVFCNLNLELVSRDKLTQLLTYETERMLVNIETNIKEHFLAHYNRYIKVVFNYYKKDEKIRKKYKCNKKFNIEIKKLNNDYNDIKYNILNVHDDILEDHYDFILEQRQKLFPNIDSIRNNVLYDVKCTPLKYLYTYFTIVDTFEKLNVNYNMEESIKYHNNKSNNNNIVIRGYNTDHENKICKVPIFKSTKNKESTLYKKIKLFSVTPLQTSLIPKYITIDSAVIIQNFGDIIKEKIKEDKTKKEKLFTDPRIINVESLRLYYNNDQTKKELWSLIFDMDDKYFKQKGNYKFNYTLSTDCFACTAPFYHKDTKTVKKGRNMTIKSKSNTDPEYVEDKIMNFSLDLDKKIVCIDPNKRDILYCGTFEDQNDPSTFKKFRYTACQRKLELKTKHYSKIRANSAEIKTKQLESLKVIDKNTINLMCIKKYIIGSGKINKLLKYEYEKPIHRKLKWYSYLNKQKSENKMIKNFKKKMGPYQKTIVVVGDHSCNSSNMPGTIPTISKRIISIFKKAQYETYLINEYNTSKICNKCGCETETFMKRTSPKPKLKKKNIQITVHGLLRCKSVKHTCEALHNRDTNAVLNMLKIVNMTKEKLIRPLLYCQPTAYYATNLS